MEESTLLEKISNRTILENDPLFAEIHHIVKENKENVWRLNTSYLSEKERNDVVSDIIGKPVDPTFSVNLPLYTDFGRHLYIGKHVFINCNVMLTDLGGIYLEDHVLIGPGATILSVNHPVDPAIRRGLQLKSVRIKKNAWIGAGATILPGVTVGENAVVAANATVTKDVPDNTIVAGIPAKVIRSIDTEENI
ncbi:sugar O-acetyltransferase [Listeria grandensis]|uniref:Sugar O-acetyltransferase n=1 Tax=Listeria grandensis TaxID=1494963 RepID=A0A7X1CRB5_9LIST|nr:DapH/DapD/GlmU-related protein [Listeria grandensis]MBC1476000.1 sugar O-acetyltransferase [Listeria grandensis]MBC1937901.1 sugar O-acetyltransferase [Listeria grandensis]MBC6316875.1 sugar O-acetyltransferase [Listeria grandensis]